MSAIVTACVLVLSGCMTAGQQSADSSKQDPAVSYDQETVERCRAMLINPYPAREKTCPPAEAKAKAEVDTHPADDPIVKDCFSGAKVNGVHSYGAQKLCIENELRAQARVRGLGINKTVRARCEQTPADGDGKRFRRIWACITKDQQERHAKIWGDKREAESRAYFTKHPPDGAVGRFCQAKTRATATSRALDLYVCMRDETLQKAKIDRQRAAGMLPADIDRYCLQVSRELALQSFVRMGDCIGKELDRREKLADL